MSKLHLYVSPWPHFGFEELLLMWMSVRRGTDPAKWTRQALEGGSGLYEQGILGVLSGRGGWDLAVQ